MAMDTNEAVRMFCEGTSFSQHVRQMDQERALSLAGEDIDYPTGDDVHFRNIGGEIIPLRGGDPDKATSHAVGQSNRAKEHEKAFHSRDAGNKAQHGSWNDYKNGANKVARAHEAAGHAHRLAASIHEDRGNDDMQAKHEKMAARHEAKGAEYHKMAANAHDT